MQRENKISYTDITEKALELEKIKLAEKLIENEPTITKRIPFYLKM